MEFLNTNWLITGATSGLGLALARELKNRGARVAIVARNEARLREVAALHGFIPIAGDISDQSQINRIGMEAFAALGRIDGLVNNASSLGASRLKLLMDTDCEEVTAALATNVLGPFRLTKIVAAQMLLNKQGLVINISSDAAVNPYPRWGAYAVSKAALDHLTRIWAAETKEHGVRFLAVDPGDMDTDLHREALPEADRSGLKKPVQAAVHLLNLLQGSLASGERGSL